MVNAAMKLKDAYSVEKKAMTNLDSILKSRDITLTTKIHLVKAMVFPIVMTNLESILKKQRHYFADKGPSSQSFGFSTSNVWT